MAESLIYLTELVGLKVCDVKGRRIGRVKDAALVPLIDGSRVDRYLVGGGWAWLTVRHDQVRSISLDGIYLRDEQLTPHHADEYMLRLVRDLLDQQIIDVSGRKVVRVTDVTFSRHEKRGGRVSLKVTYRCGLAFHTEWVCFEHEGYPRRKAASWWRERAPELEVPESVDEALILADRLRRPNEIAVRPAGRFTEITAYRFAPCLTAVPGSAPSAIENPAAGAGSTRASASPTRGATRAAGTSAAGFASASATGGRA
jgi:sporulation protein YlmC with PRC-barrel domain